MFSASLVTLKSSCERTDPRKVKIFRWACWARKGGQKELFYSCSTLFFWYSRGSRVRSGGIRVYQLLMCRWFWGNEGFKSCNSGRLPCPVLHYVCKMKSLNWQWSGFGAGGGALPTDSSSLWGNCPLAALFASSFDEQAGPVGQERPAKTAVRNLLIHVDF